MSGLSSTSASDGRCEESKSCQGSPTVVAWQESVLWRIAVQMSNAMHLRPVVLRGELGDCGLVGRRVFCGPVARGAPCAIQLFPQSLGCFPGLSAQHLPDAQSERLQGAGIRAGLKFGFPGFGRNRFILLRGKAIIQQGADAKRCSRHLQDLFRQASFLVHIRDVLNCSTLASL